MKKKIIFIQSFKFLDFHYNLYEIGKLKKYFDVECHDLTSIKNKNIELYYSYLKNNPKIKKFRNPWLWKKRFLMI